MKKIVLLALFLLPFLGACTVAPVATTPQIVQVPVAVPCPAEMPPSPQQPFNDTATPDMSPLLKAQLYAAQSEYQQGYTDRLESTLRACLRDRNQ